MQPGRDRGPWPVARQLSAGDAWRWGAGQGMQNRAKANGESVHIAEKPKSWPELCAAGQRKQATMQQPNWAPTADCTKNSWAAAGDAEGEEEEEGREMAQATALVANGCEGYGRKFKQLFIMKYNKKW